MWAGWQELETYVNGTLTERRTFGNGLDEMVRLEKVPSGDVYLLVYDDSGNLVLVTDDTGEPVERYEYSPFGQRFVYADTAPPVVEQVRFKSNGGNLEIWIEVSEEIDETALQQQMSSGALRLTDLDEDVDLAISVSQPVVTGRQARRRLVITTTDPPAEETNVELVIPAAALVDQAEQEASADYVKSFQWPAGEAIVDDTAAPRLDTVCVKGDQLEIQLSEEPDLTQFQSVVTVDGLELTWTVGADRYTLISQTLSSGSHSLSMPAGVALDLNGLGLATSYSETFEIAEDPVNEVLFDSVRPGQLVESAIGILHGFHGRPFDPETGLVYFRNRYYDPDLGRFISTDPEEYGDSPSLYQFAGNNPVNFGDPTGEIVDYGWDGFSLAMSFNSLITDLKEGNYGMATLSAFGVLVDAAAFAVPFVPGGAGVALKACRAATVIKMAQAVDAGLNAAVSANAAYRSFEQGDVGEGLFNAGMAVLGARGAASNVRATRRSCLFNCFAEGTLVLTEDGERPIEEVAVGDRVWAWNEETGESELAEVVRLFERETLEVYTLHVGVGEVLETTDEHPFWVVGRGWVEVEDLRPGDILTTYEGQELRLVAVERQERSLRVYNFEVRGLHTYFVGDAQVLVHNCAEKRKEGNLTSDEGDFVSLFKAPQGGRTGVAQEVVEGFSPGRYPGNGPYFSTDPAIVAEYMFHYRNGMQEIRIPRHLYDEMLGDGVIVRDTFEVNSVYVPARGLDRFNETLRQGPPNVYYPQP